MKKLKIFTLIAFSIFFVAACTRETNQDELRDSLPPEIADEIDELENNTPEQDMDPKLTAESARYKITFTSRWSEETHPGNYPENAHFSPFVAYSHNNTEAGKIFVAGQPASAGMEEMAETGKTDMLKSEIESIISNGNAGEYVIGDRIDSPGETSREIRLTDEYSVITLVSMIAPSPDWFVSIQNVDMMDFRGQWLPEQTVTLSGWDAGTDSGTTFTAADVDSKEIVDILYEPDFGPGKEKNLGSVLIERID